MLDSEGVEQHAVTYPGPARTGHSFARDAEGFWQWSENPTPGQANSFPESIAESTEGDNSNSSGSDIDPTHDEETENTVDPNESNDVSMPDSGGDSDPFSVIANIWISEFLPDPSGSDDSEWIEIHNSEEREVSLYGWQVDDQPGGSWPFFLNEYRIAPDGYLIVPKSASKIGLNNGGDYVRLINPLGNEVDSVSYQAAPVGKSYVKTANGWAWSDSPTPGLANSLMSIEPTEPNPTANPNEIPSQEPADAAAVHLEGENWIPMSELADLEDDALVRFSGVVSLPFGVLGKSIMTVQSYDGLFGAELRMYSPDRPALEYGQPISVEGRLSRSGSDWRINVVKHGILVDGPAQDITPSTASPADIDEDYRGRLVSITGLMSSKNGRKLKLTDNQGQSEITASLVEKEALPGKIGDTAEATGVIRWSNGSGELIVPTRSGVKIVMIAPEENEAISPLAASLKAAGNDGPGPNGRQLGWPLALAGAGLAGILSWVWQGRRRRNAEG